MNHAPAHSQEYAPVTPTSDTGVPVVTPTVNSPSGSPASAVNSILNSIPSGQPGAPIQPAQPAPTSGKYEEHQSVCRINEYDTIAYYSDELKNIRIKILQNRIQNSINSIPSKFNLLKEYVAQKDIKAAQSLAEDLKKHKLANVEIQFADALMAYLKGDQKKSRDLLTSLLTENSKNIEALHLLAEVYSQDQNYFETSSIYIDLVKITGKNFDDYLCESYTLDAQYADAETFCLKSANKSKNPMAFINLGVASREQGKPKEAKKYFEDAIKVKKTEMAYTCLGEIFMMNKDFNQAISNFKQAILISPQSYRAVMALAWAFFENKERAMASTYFQQACAMKRAAITEVRKALKILLTEKSELTANYSKLLLKCE